MIKWKCDVRWLGKPVPVEVVSETKCFVTVRETGIGISGKVKVWENRIKKDNTIFDTFDDAKAALIAAAKHKVATAEAQLEYANNKLKKYIDMKEPS